jgi:DNA-directed RNA polymerase subunit E'/Rpb7
LVGRISSSNKDGILVSLEFLDDVFIPSYLLQAPSKFKPESKLWVWEYGEEDSGDEFVMGIGEQVFALSLSFLSLSNIRFHINNEYIILYI